MGSMERIMSKTDVRTIRAGLKHPIIDADGHWAEFHPHMRQEFKRIGGNIAVEAFDMATARIPNSLNMSVADRSYRRIGQEAFWFLPTKNTLDRATAMMPKLLYERLDEIGLDFCVVYPTSALGWYRLPSEKHRRALVRAYNTFTADQFRPYSDRIIPAAIIPMYSPEEGVEDRSELSPERALDPAPQLAVELLLQPHRSLRIRKRSDGKSVVLRRRDAAIPGAQLRLPRRGSGLGVLALRGSHRPLGETQSGGTREYESRAARSRRHSRAGREVREAGGAGGRAPRRRARRQRRRHGRCGAPRRLLALRDHAQGGLHGPLRQPLLLRLRGRRSDQRLGLQQEGAADGCAPQRVLQLGHRPLRRAGYDQGSAGGVRTGRARVTRRR